MVPIHHQEENYFMLNWPALLHHPNAAPPTVFADQAVRACGYIAQSVNRFERDAGVADFVLLPEAGNFLHAAHQFGDQMIAVHLEAGQRLQYSPKLLLWVWGTFHVYKGDPNGSTPLYAIDHARAKPANVEDLRKYFR